MVYLLSILIKKEANYQIVINRVLYRTYILHTTMVVSGYIKHLKYVCYTSIPKNNGQYATNNSIRKATSVLVLVL